MTDGPMLTEKQYMELLAARLERETAGLQAQMAELATARDELTEHVASLNAEKSELAGRIDVLEAAKSAAETARDDAAAEFEAYKTHQAEIAAIAARKTERVDRVRAAAPHLTDDFTGNLDRQQRWAEMAEEAFVQHVNDLVEVAVAAFSADERRQVAEAEDKATVIAEILASRQTASDTRATRQTAAFSAGVSPNAKTEKISATRRLLVAGGRIPAKAI
jgi:DNA repair exonuclease SbcCD ATPase subunit